MKALAIAEANLRRLFRERANVFFLFVLPMLIILLLGSVFGSESARIGVAAADSGRLGAELVASLEDTENLDVRRFTDERALEGAVERGRVEAGVVAATAVAALVAT
ncbi:MAG: ABC transporter permease, partial [Actinomycetota bacterium]|nr:ABC transporter permease [Actinomycetota bacterium]